jgi:phosphoglycolate phosphatase-like HAD superfamily hydrolase
MSTWLLLFDIDGTLVYRATRAHSDAMYEALWRVHGVRVRETDRRFSPAGRTDGEIARLLLLAAGVSASRIDERADRVREETCGLYAELCPADLSEYVLPGIVRLLEWLAEVPDVQLSLLTGNFEAVARLKLRRAGVGRFFPAGQGAFGSDSEDRAALPAVGRRRAGANGRPWPRERALVIGDTPRDIACARADGLRVAAVATGPYPVAELGDADWAVRSASELRGVLETLLES